jgi:hypothetical protein
MLVLVAVAAICLGTCGCGGGSSVAPVSQEDMTKESLKLQEEIAKGAPAKSG